MFENAHFINIGFDPAVAYNDLPKLPPTGKLETTAVLKMCIQARAALAELNQICRHFPNQQILWKLFSLSESQSSAALDGDEVPIQLLFQQGTNSNAGIRRSAGHDKTALERVFRIRQTLSQGYEITRNRALDVTLLLELCSSLEGKPMALRRDESASTEQRNLNGPQYVPPAGVETIQKLLHNWESFVDTDAGNLDPLVLIAVAHYQMEAISPFASSNGTLTRILDYLLLYDEELLAAPVLGWSNWMRQNYQEGRRLQSLVTQQHEWERWIHFFVTGIYTASQIAIQKINTLEKLYKHTDYYIKDKLPKTYSEELVVMVFQQPCTRIQDIVEQGIAKRQTASVYLKQLCDLGILGEVPFGKEKLFVHHKLLQLVAQDDRLITHYRE